MNPPKNKNNILDLARSVFDIEIEGLHAVSDRLDVHFETLVQYAIESLQNGGKLVLCGVGKSGHIGHKIAATLASTGSTAVFLHPVEALHGDIGVLQDKDLLIAISYSGETDELLWALPAAKRLGVKIAAITGGLQSRLAQFADVTVGIKVPREACPFNLAPTTTTTVTLALGDALAMVLLQERGFTKSDFGRLHPGGAIGRAVTMRVSDIMRSEAPCLKPSQTVKEVLFEMTRLRSGSAAIVDADAHVLGIFTDGDFRRHAEDGMDILNMQVERVMTRNPITISATALAVEALKIFETKKIDDLVAVDATGKFAGMVDIQDLPGLKLL